MSLTAKQQGRTYAHAQWLVTLVARRKRLGQALSKSSVVAEFRIGNTTMEGIGPQNYGLSQANKTDVYRRGDGVARQRSELPNSKPCGEFNSFWHREASKVANPKRLSGSCKK